MKNVYKVMLVAAMAVAGGVTAYHAQTDELQLSSLALDNVEAIANGEVSIPYLCAGDIKACVDDYYNEIFDGFRVW